MRVHDGVAGLQTRTLTLQTIAKVRTLWEGLTLTHLKQNTEPLHQAGATVVGTEVQTLNPNPDPGLQADGFAYGKVACELFNAKTPENPNTSNSKSLKP